MPMLGTPQWNQSILAQLVALNWLRVEDAARLGTVIFALLAVVLFALAAVKIRSATDALQWSALLSGVLFALNSGDVQFFYWRMVLLLFLLYFIMSQPTTQPASPTSTPDS
jgi:hypothetical protein